MRGDGPDEWSAAARMGAGLAHTDERASVVYQGVDRMKQVNDSVTYGYSESDTQVTVHTFDDCSQVSYRNVADAPVNPTYNFHEEPIAEADYREKLDTVTGSLRIGGWGRTEGTLQQISTGLMTATVITEQPHQLTFVVLPDEDPHDALLRRAKECGVKDVIRHSEPRSI